MPRYIAGTVAALCMFVASRASATEHITIDLASGLNMGAGWGELTPERHDLRITLIAPAGMSFYNDVTAQDATGQTLWDVESYTGSTYTFVSYGAQEDEMGWINVGGTVFDPGDPMGWMSGQMFSVRVSNALWPCASCPYENGMPVNPNDCNTGYICSLLEEGEVSIPVPGSKSASVTVHHGLPGTLTILGAGNGLEVLNPDETPFSSAYITGSGMHTVPLLLRADESFTGSVTLTCRFLQDGADLDSQDVVEAKPVVVDLDIAGVEEEDEQEVGGFIAVRTSDNPAPRKQITLKVEGLEEGTATLTRSNARVRVFTASEDGEEITFNGQDNTWPVNAVPGSLYVQGAAASLGFRDVVLTLAADGAGSDNVNFTVLLATFSEVRTGFRKGGAGGDPTNWDIPPAPVVATASPTAIAVDEQGNVEIALGIDGATRVTDPFDIEPVMDGMPPMPTGAISFRVRGKSATPATNDDPPQAVIDCWMAARWTDPHGEVHVIGRRPPLVLVPRYIGCPFPQANGAVQGQNRGLNRDTSPGLFNVQPPNAQLVTIYAHWLTVQVQDQFRVNLDALYEGAPVRETLVGRGRGRVQARNRVINQFLDAQGRYQDPVGVFSESDPGPPARGPIVTMDQNIINAWEMQSDPPDTDPFPMQALNDPQRIRATVGGHVIEPIIERTMIATPPGNIQIIWTPPADYCPDP